MHQFAGSSYKLTNNELLVDENGAQYILLG